MKRATSSVPSLIALGTLVAATLAGCAPSNAPAALHVLRFADGQDVTHLNSLLITTYAENYPAELTGGYLTRRDARNRAYAELASAVPTLANGGISRDGKTIVFHLRSGLRWSDGAPLTANDAVFTTRRIIAKDTPVSSTAGWDQIASVDAPNGSEVRFRLKTSYGPAVDTFFASQGAYAILPEHLLAKVADLRKTPFNDLPVGAGPFRYTAFRRGERLEMEANPYYFRGRPKLDRIVYVFLPDENTVTTQLLTGEIDIALRVPPTQLARLRGAPGVSLVRTPSDKTGYIGFNTAKAPFDDIRVRRALRLALDRQSMVARVYHGAGSTSEDVVTPLDPFLGRSIPLEPQDRKRAAALLDAAGWRTDATGVRRRDGKRLSIDFVALTGNRIAATLVELVRSQWAALGVSIDLRTLAADVVFAPDGTASRGDYGAMIFGQGLDSQSLFAAVACSAIPPRGFNYGRLCDPQVDDLLRAADRSQNPAVRASFYLAARKRIAAGASVIPLIHREDDHFIRNGVTGFRPDGVTLFDDAMDLDNTGATKNS